MAHHGVQGGTRQLDLSWGVRCHQLGFRFQDGGLLFVLHAYPQLSASAHCLRGRSRGSLSCPRLLIASAGRGCCEGGWGCEFFWLPPGAVRTTQLFSKQPSLGLSPTSLSSLSLGFVPMFLAAFHTPSCKYYLCEYILLKFHQSGRPSVFCWALTGSTPALVYSEVWIAKAGFLTVKSIRSILCETHGA